MVWNLQRLQTLASSALGVMNAFASGARINIAAAIAQAAVAGAIGLIQIGAVEAARPVKKFQTGGIVRATGGGQLGVLAENGQSEYMFNTGESGDPFVRKMGAAIADYLVSSGLIHQMIAVTLELDTEVLARAVAPVYESGQVRLKI